MKDNTFEWTSYSWQVSVKRAYRDGRKTFEWTSYSWQVSVLSYIGMIVQLNCYK